MRHSPYKSRTPERVSERARSAPMKSSTPLGDDRFEELIRGGERLLCGGRARRGG